MTSLRPCFLTCTIDSEGHVWLRFWRGAWHRAWLQLLGREGVLPETHREECLQKDRDRLWAFVYRAHLSSDGCSQQSLFASSSWKHESRSVWRTRALLCQTFHPCWGRRAPGTKTRVGPRLYTGTERRLGDRADLGDGTAWARRPLGQTPCLASRSSLESKIRPRLNQKTGRER